VEIIDDKGELVEAIKQIRKKSFLKGYPVSEELAAKGVSVGSEGDDNNRYAWNTPSIEINYRGETIAVRPVTLGTLALNKSRQFAEYLLHGKEKKDVKAEREKNRIKREDETYANLHEEGFNTLDSRQYLIEGENISDKVLLTTPTPKGRHIIDALSEDGLEGKLEHLKNAAKTEKEMHEKYNTVDGDASLVNFAYDQENELQRFNYGFKPNPYKNDEDIKASNVVNLCISGVYRSGLEPESVIKAMIDAYQPSEEMKQKILDQSQVNDVSMIKKPVQGIYNSLVYGMNQPEINDIKSTISTYIGV